MKYVVMVKSVAIGPKSEFDGQYILHWNPHTKVGVVEYETTPDITKAKQFANALEAFEEWQAVSKEQFVHFNTNKLHKPLAGIPISIIPVDNANENRT